MNPELTALVEAAAGEVGGVERWPGERAVEYHRAGAVFAAVDDTGADFLLGDQLARAAAGTPGARISDRGRGWVRLEPGRLDRFARDRASAWFSMAWRTAGRQKRA